LPPILAIDAQYPRAMAALAIAVLNAGLLGWAEDIDANYAEAYKLALSATIGSRLRAWNNSAICSIAMRPAWR
jgi:hypothetical protein